MKNLLKKTLLTLSIASSLCASEIKYNPGLVEYSIFNVSKDGFKDFVVEQKIDPAILQNLYGDMSNPKSVLITAIAYDYGHQRPDLAEPFYEEAVKKEYGGATLATLGTEKNIEFREKQKYDEKKEIARCISSILMAHNSMIIDSGSTCQSCCSYINLMPSKDIFTVSIGAFEQLDGNLHNVFLTPGKKREKNQRLCCSKFKFFKK